MIRVCRECIEVCCYDPRKPTTDFLFRQRYPNEYPRYWHPLCWECPNYDPNEEKIPEPQEPEEVTHRHINYNSNISKREWDRIEQVIRKASYLENQINELKVTKKKEDDAIPF